MQSNFYVDAKDILLATNGGLDIILQLYPQAAGSETNRTRKFKIHEEKTASASLKKTADGNWLVTDFGDDQQPRNGIQCFMKEKGLEYVDALRQLAVQYNVVSEDKQAQLIRAEYSEEPAGADDVEGKWTWDIRKHFTDAEIETIISKNVLGFLGWKKEIPGTFINEKGQLEEKSEAAVMAPYNRITGAFRDYRWHPLISYSFVKGRKKMTFSATDQYPIFLIDEGSHQKIYQPRHPDKSRRFMYAGEKPKDFIHGLAQLTSAYEKNKKLIEEDKNEQAEDEDRTGDRNKADARKSKEARLPEVILVSGGSDGINVALLGYRVIWMNSETAPLHQYQYDKIALMVEKFYQLPDIDATGRRTAHDLNMQYLDMYSIELPEELKKFKDSRGNPCKDLRDYMNHFKRKDFKMLVDIALPYRFWDKKAEFEGKGDDKKFVGWKYEFRGVQALNFLYKNGFGQLDISGNDDELVYIRQVGNIVQETSAKKIRGFIDEFLENRYFDVNLRDAMLYTSRLGNDMLSRLKSREVDFTDNTPASQFLFFTNYTLEVTAEEVFYHKPGTVERYIWEDDVLNHRIVRPKEEPFTITRDDLGNYDIVINDTKSPFLQYLVQTSRVHWREELENRLDKMTPVDAEHYRREHKCSIAGPNLTPEEIDEQKLHLVNKIFVIGFLLHRYKARDKGWFVWAQDNKINEDGKSHGGSGKSILFDICMRAMLKKSITLNGRNNKLNDDQFKYDGVDEHTRYLLVDDAHEYLKLDPFYKDITGDLNVNPKGKTAFIIPFEKSCKMVFTSNFAARDIGPSTERRMVPSAFSDFYHDHGENDDYREARDPKTDLGYRFFEDFESDDWNSFYQAMIHCLKFYLGTSGKVKPAMGNVTKRNLLAEMGDFYDFGLTYFSEEAGRADTCVVRDEFQKDYCRFHGGKELTPQTMMRRLQAFCRYQGYVLNPKPMLNKDKKIIQKVAPRLFSEALGEWQEIPQAQKVTKEMIYVQTKNELEPDEEDAAEPVVTAAQTIDNDEDELPF